jgi:hypothetical protein
MADVSRLLSLVLALLAVALLAALLQPEWASDLGLDRGWLAPLRCEFFDPGEPSPQPEAIREILRREAVKDRAANDLIDGRLTLLEVAALFRSLNAERVGPQADLALYYPGDSEEERVCRQAIRWTKREMARRYPERADALADRLEAELRRYKELRGAVVLPDVTDLRDSLSATDAAPL